MFRKTDYLTDIKKKDVETHGLFLQETTTSGSFSAISSSNDILNRNVGQESWQLYKSQIDSMKFEAVNEE